MRCMTVVLLLCVGAMSGCTTRYLDFMPDEEAIYEYPLEDVWPHVRTFFDANNFRYREDPGSFVLETEWREEFGGSRVSGFWHRYMVMGKRETPTRSKLWIIRNTRSAADALRVTGSEISWGVSRGLGSEGGSGSTQAGSIESDDQSPLDRYGSAEDSTEVMFQPKGENAIQGRSRQGVRDLLLEWKVYEHISPHMVAKRSSDTPEVVKQVKKEEGPPKPVIECGAPILGLGKVARPGHVVLMGEMHGTQQVPHFLAQAVCQAATQGVPVTVGLEMPVGNQERVERFIASEGTEEDWGLLMESPFWRSPYPDGRNSEATVGLLDGLRKLRAQGLDVRAFAFDHPPLEGEEREEAMAKTVLEVAARAKERLVLVLSGNVHPRQTKGLSWMPEYRPMGLRIARARSSVYSLDMAYDSGTAWICAVGAKNKLECGVREASGHDNGERYFIHLFSGLSREGYHGIFYVGPVSASLPAVRYGVEPAGEVQTGGETPPPQG